MANIYSQVSQNKIRSNLLIILFISFITSAAYLISYALNTDSSLVYSSFVFSLFISGISYFFGDKIVLNLNGAKPANRQEFFDFYTVTENLCLGSGLPMPKIYVIQTEAMNAFATGTDPQNASICATSGLLQKLTRTELEGVIAHELSHIKSFDTRLMTLVSILIGGLSILINSRSRFFVSDDDDNKKSPILQTLGLFLIIFAPIIGKLIQFAISRQTEYAADTGAVMLTHQPQGLISALTKISHDSYLFTEASYATASLYIYNPFKSSTINSLFSTHPSVEDRIKKLQQIL